jgi:3'-phosphoadenosine 5'-phosphosulfate sulfotransferase (PAPS reductase)/FAD synthetase
MKDDRPIIASVSGGKDSTAMCLHLQELGLKYTPVFMDTGWENRETYQYLKEYLPEVIGEITWIEPKIDLPEDLEALAQSFEERLGHRSAMIRFVLKKGMFPSRKRRFCTQELKVFVIRDYIQSLDFEPINAVGIRGEESDTRAKMSEWEWNETFDCETWRPLIGWSSQDVIDIHTRNGVIPNKNYLDGASRVGCWPCIYARKSEIRHIAKMDPQRIDILEDLEQAVTDLAEARYQEKGTSFEELGYARPAWFVNPMPRRDKEGKRSGDPWPIRKVVEWSRTKDRNGRQFELFSAPPRERGCVRWGLCDVQTEEQ